MSVRGAAAASMREHPFLRSGGKKGFSGNICGQHFASTPENALQHVAPTFPTFPMKTDLYISVTQPRTLTSDDQHFVGSTIGSLGVVCAGAPVALMRAQPFLRRGGNNGFNGNIFGQHLASTSVNALQQVFPIFSNLPVTLDL